MVLTKKHSGICVFLFSLLLTGCSLFRSSPPQEEIVLFMVVDRSVYRPNDPVLGTLRVQNLTEDSLKIYYLDARSVTFYRVNEETGEPLEVMPVFSEKEPMLTVTEIEPHGGMERTFVFTNATRKRGEFALQAFFESSPFEGVKGRPTVISEARKFTVSGDPLFERDVKGVLKKQDAIEIAKKRLGEPVREAEATLVKNEAGFYDWWVILNLEGKTDEKGLPAKKAYFINPYLAVVRKKANPFVSPPKKEEKKPPVQFKKKSKMQEAPVPAPPLPNLDKGKTK